MCGIAGVLNLREPRPIDETLLMRMNGILKHRGPDESGIYVDRWVGLAHARLSVVGLESGTQPISNEDETLWIVFNGEIFNHVELRRDLEKRGHRFRTDTDTEVILHAYEEHGTGCVNLFNGQFAFALWDSSRQMLFLARDRVGIRPLFFTRCGDRLVFGSEVKALFLAPGVERRLDPRSLLEVTTLWSTLPGRTAFAGIEELPPGHVMTVRDGRIERHRYWRTPASEPSDMWSGTIGEAAEAVEAVLTDAVRLRLRSDVEVGAYLSGGLDSSLITAIVAERFDSRVRTFSVAFEEARFDESDHQREMVRHLGLDHTEARLENTDIASMLEQVIWHTEGPLLRTGPVPLYRLSGLVSDHGLKVVLTGEGADEVFGGYDIFKEAKVRRFWGKSPDSRWRHLLLVRLYPYVFADRDRSRGPLRAFFARSLADPDDPLYSHRVRWNNGARNGGLLHDDWRSTLAGYDPVEEIARTLPADFGRRTHLSQAQALEMESFLSGYLLSSQGDRVAMAHSVEGRFPFLDHRLIELASRIPDRWKIRALDEKHLLKQVAARHVPESIVRRRKQPYRAPIQEAVGGPGEGAAGPLDHLLAPDAVVRSGIFDLAKVSHLRRRLREGHVLGEVQSMAAMLVLSVQMLHEHFVGGFPRIAEAREPDRMIRRSGEPSRAVAGGAS